MWHKDKQLVVFRNYGVQKAHKPGHFKKKKGGISSNISAERHAEESRKAVQALLEEFGSYARIPPVGKKCPDYGLAWIQPKRKGKFRKDPVAPRKVKKREKKQKTPQRMMKLMTECMRTHQKKRKRKTFLGFPCAQDEESGHMVLFM